MASEDANLNEETWIEAWHEAKPGLWQARLTVADLPCDFLLTVRNQPDGRHVA